MSLAQHHSGTQGDSWWSRNLKTQTEDKDGGLTSCRSYDSTTLGRKMPFECQMYGTAAEIAVILQGRRIHSGVFFSVAAETGTN